MFAHSQQRKANLVLHDSTEILLATIGPYIPVLLMGKDA